MGKAIKTILKIVAVLLVFAILGVAIAGIIYFTNGLTDDFKSFYLEVDGKIVLDDTPITLSEDKEYTLKAKYLLPTSDNPTFTVKVIPNVEYNFSFVTKDNRETFDTVEDLSNQFKVDIESENITIKLLRWDLKAILEENLGESISFENDYKPNYANAYFVLVVSSSNGKISYNLPIQPHIAVKEITIDKSDIIIGGEK